MSSSVTPPPPPPPPAAAQPPSPNVTVPRVPEAMQRLPIGQTVEARVIALTHGTAVVDGGKDLGRFALRTTLPLPEGAKIQLMLTALRGDSAQMRIVSLNDTPLPQGLATLAGQGLGGRGATPQSGLPSPLASTPAQASGPAAVALSLGGGKPIDAVVLRAPEGGLLLRSGVPPLTTGSQISLRLMPPTPQAVPAASLAAGGAGGAGAGAGGAGGTGATPAPGGSTGPAATPSPAASPGTPISTSPASPAPTGAPTGAPTPTATPGAPQAAHTVGATGKGQPIAAKAGTGAGTGAGEVARPGTLGTLSGTITANTAGGNTMVRIGGNAGLIALSGRSDIPAGSQVTLEVVGRAPPPPPPPPGAPLTQPVATLPAGPAGGAVSSWPTLTDSLALLSRTDPAAARQLAQAIPGSDARMIANGVAYVAAVQSGNVRAWLGEGPLRALDRAGPRGRALGQALSDEVKELGSRPRESSGEWRSLQMPFALGGTIDRIEVVTRRFGRDDDEDELRKRGQGGGERFLINITPEAFGPLQIDGLFTKARRQLDLVLRTTVPLPDAMCREIIGIHARNAAALDLGGSVTFHVTDRFPGPEEDGGGQTVTA